MTATQALQHPWLTVRSARWRCVCLCLCLWLDTHGQMSYHQKNAPDTKLKTVGNRMNTYMKLHKEQSRASQPTSADDA